MDDYLRRRVEEVRADREHDHETGLFFETFAEIFGENPVIDDRDGEWFLAHDEWFRRPGPHVLEIEEGEFRSVGQFANLKDGYTAEGEPRG